jgi:hypothetical protein
MFNVNFTADYLKNSAPAHRQGQPAVNASDQALPVIIPLAVLCTTLPLRGTSVKKVR